MMAPDPAAYTSHFVSHSGAVRSVNEDAYLEAPDLGLWAIADGMGGHEAGELASRLVIDALDSIRPDTTCEGMVRQVKDRMAVANRRIREVSAMRFYGRLIGSTAAVLVICGETGVCLWAGDSRVYRYRGSVLSRLTRDHSRTEEMIAMGVLEVHDAADSRFANIITRAVGVEDHLELEVRAETLDSADLFLMCSDGLNKVVTDEEIGKAVGSAGVDAATALLELALRRAPTDNVTIGVIAADGASEPPTLVRR
jgi:serine/threonine protein phosphatase PrpC